MNDPKIPDQKFSPYSIDPVTGAYTEYLVLPTPEEMEELQARPLSLSPEYAEQARASFEEVIESLERASSSTPKPPTDQ